MRYGFLAGVVFVIAGVLAGGDTDRDVTAAAAIRKAPDCPAKLLPLGSNPIGLATRAAMKAERRRDRPQVRGAAVATLNFGRSGQVVHNCGSRIAASSVVVTIHRRAHDSGRNKSASLSEGIVVVGRFQSGWRIWDVLH